MTKLTVSGPGSFKDSSVKPLLDLYRQVVAQRYTACAPLDMPRLLGAAPFYMSRKLDGEFWYLRMQSSHSELIAGNGRVAHGKSAITAAAESLGSGIVIAGELYVDKAGTRERVGDVQSALAAGGEKLMFAAFDLIMDGDMTWREVAYPARLEMLQGLLPTEGAVYCLPVRVTESPAEIDAFYKQVVEEDSAEGIVVRCADGRALKIKPEITLDLVVLGYTVRDSGSSEPECRSLLLGLVAPDGAIIPVGTVGNFAADINRKELLELLTQLNVESEYRQAASTGQMYQMVRPEVLVECRVLDLQSENSSGKPIRRPELALEEDKWRVTGTTQALTLLNPILTRMRADKPDIASGARWEQVAEILPISESEKKVLASVEVIRRQVWTKTTKDKTDVRKLVVWKTNRELEDSSYPAYVVHWTDYSAGRKSPLNREVRPAPTLDEATRVAELLIADNIKKGWEESPGS